MKYLKLLASLCLLTAATAAEPAIKHQFVCIGNHKNVLVHVDQFTPNNSWSIPLPKGSRDIQLISPKTLLVSHGTGAAEYQLSDGKKLKWSVSGYKGIQSARRLANGTTILLSSKGKLITLDEEGKELSSVQIKHKPLDLRLLRVSSQGNWTIGSKKPQAVLEINAQGNILQQTKLAGKGYTATKLSNGNYLASTGDECKVVEVKVDGSVVRFVGGKKQHPTLKLDFNSGWNQLDNGNIIMTNWLGHGKHNSASHLLEFDTNNKLVWQWDDHQAVKQVTNLLVIK
ncbi:MAG: hypothetical protein ACI9FG_000725 [Crocinitomicaceae bacterium]|jgi:hypothetical protein